MFIALLHKEGVSLASITYSRRKTAKIQGGSNMTGTICV
jgi:hypothetical protein